MLFYTQPSEPWDALDFKLIEAYQIMQDETCPKCGQPVWLCRSTDNRVAWKFDSSVCWVTRKQEEQSWAKNNKGKDKKKPKDAAEWGKIYFPVAFVPPNIDGELPGRTEYFQSLSEVN